MATGPERIYELAATALDRQLRNLADARAGVPPVGAAATLLAVALGGAAFRAPGAVNTTLAAAGALGTGLVLLGGVFTLLGAGLADVEDIDAVGLARGLDLVDADNFHLGAAFLLDARRRENRTGIARARAFYQAALVGLVVEAAGFVSAVVLHF